MARALADRGMVVLVNHGPGEEALAEAVRNSSGGVAVPLKCSLGELIALTRRAHLFIGGDTGPMHLAAALRVPVVALFGPTRPERNGPFGTPSVVLRSPDSVFSSTHTDRRDEGLVSIKPQAVMEAADQLLGEQAWLRWNDVWAVAVDPSTHGICVCDFLPLARQANMEVSRRWRSDCVAGLAIRAAASGQVKKNQELTMTGPYAYVRNPLYLGSIVIAIGFAVAARDVCVAVAILVMFALIYVPVIRARGSIFATTIFSL